MRIQHNIASMNAYRNFKKNTSGINRNLEKLSSGYKINRAGDDAAGLAISEKMRAQISGLKIAQKNCKDGIGMIQTAEGALAEVHSMLNRMYELAEQSANGTYSSVDRGALDMEVQALKEEITRIGQTANFNGRKLFGSTSNSNINGMRFVIGENADSTMTMSFSMMGGAQLNLASLSISSVNILTASTALAQLTVLTAAINEVSKLRAKLGAYQNRLEHTMQNLSVMQENVQDAESSIRDTDVADEMMAYTSNSIMVQASQAMLAQANQQPQGVLQLLQ